MFKIGILGSDNSHALRYSSLINCEDPTTGKLRFPGYRVTHIYGMDEKVTRERAEGGRIENIVERPEDMLGKVDAVIVVFRHGDLHYPYVLPFLEAGVPAFVDKPFTIKIEDVKKMIEAAKKSGAILTGGSSGKYLKDLRELKKKLDETYPPYSEEDKFTTAFVNYEINLSPQYGGIHFYGPHTVEPALLLFGCGVRSVYASRMDKNILAILKYERKQVVLNFMYQGKGFYICVGDSSGMFFKQISEEDDYITAMENFINVLKSGKSDLTSEHILMSVVVLNAIERSIAAKREVEIKELL